MLKSRSFLGLSLFGLLAVGLITASADRRPGTRLPHPKSASPVGWADETTCSECHAEQAELFAQTGHAQTLQPANTPSSIEFLQQINSSTTLEDQAASIRFQDDRIFAQHGSGTSRREISLDWCFGSGHHARTWVGLLKDTWGEHELVEFRWSYFHKLDDFGLTPGQSEERGDGYFASLGVLYDAPKARRCFACHSTVLPQTAGRPDIDAIHPGVTCQRCHGPRQQHVQSEGEIQAGFWANASQIESVNRCGECHRVAGDQEPDEIRKDDPDLARFQPVGLVQSACFLNSSELTCVSCHNPHRPLATQDSLGIWQCVQCHDPHKPEQTTCRAGHRDDCLTCHMPKVSVFDTLTFTDHWIRIRSPQDAPPR